MAKDSDRERKRLARSTAKREERLLRRWLETMDAVGTVGFFSQMAKDSGFFSRTGKRPGILREVEQALLAKAEELAETFTLLLRVRKTLVKKSRAQNAGDDQD